MFFCHSSFSASQTPLKRLDCPRVSVQQNKTVALAIAVCCTCVYKQHMSVIGSLDLIIIFGLFCTPDKTVNNGMSRPAVGKSHVTTGCRRIDSESLRDAHRRVFPFIRRRRGDKRSFSVLTNQPATDGCNIYL